MASEFKFVSERVVCWNTLQMALGETAGQRVKVYHYNRLDSAAVKRDLGISESVWANFIRQAKALATIKVSDSKAVSILRKVYEVPAEKIVEGERLTDQDWLAKATTARKVLELYQGAAIGAELATVRGTAWGLVNATTEFYDHASNTRSTDNRLSSAWFGTGAQRKQDIVDACFATA
jgi:phage/plasmid-like protein (TIGR03299 family)